MRSISLTTVLAAFLAVTGCSSNPSDADGQRAVEMLIKECGLQDQLKLVDFQKTNGVHKVSESGMKIYEMMYNGNLEALKDGTWEGREFSIGESSGEMTTPAFDPNSPPEPSMGKLLDEFHNEVPVDRSKLRWTDGTPPSCRKGEKLSFERPGVLTFAKTDKGWVLEHQGELYDGAGHTQSDFGC